MTDPIRSGGSAQPPTPTSRASSERSEHAGGATTRGSLRERPGEAMRGDAPNGFRERLKELGPAGAPFASASRAAGRHGSLGVAGNDAGSDAGALTARKLGGRSTPNGDGAWLTTGRDRSAGARAASTTDPPRELDPSHPAAAELTPFRIGPSILAAPIARAAMEPTAPLDPAQFSAEIVEALRVGRFGRDGHALTMRVRGARSAIDVDLRSENGRLWLRMSGDDDAEVTRVRERVRADLAGRGIEVDEDA